MHDRLKQLGKRYDELNMLLADPAVLSDQSAYRRLALEHASLRPTVELAQEMFRLEKNLADNRLLLQQSDEQEFRELIKEEINDEESRIGEIRESLLQAMMPQDPNDQRNIICEIRAGTGGEEAALFAAVLFRMYTAYAESQGWRTELIDVNETELGGYKEIIFMIEGQGAYSRLKFESGVHRVQRVPVTESGGRIHTSAVTVAVLPEADDVEVNIDPNDLVIDTFRASGAGGQHVNRTDSAIRITHIPSGLVVTCQDQRSQHKNKDKAMAVLKARLLELEKSQQDGQIASDRKSQVGSGDRSERIRTYNYHQGRVTDHRIGLTLYRLEEVLAGDLDEIIRSLITAARTEQQGADAL